MSEKTVTIRNDVPRRDAEGEILDAHEPCLEHFEGRFYFDGAGYDGHSGWTADNVINCYSSPDLENWESHGAIVPPDRQVAPCVRFNSASGKYVLWQVAPGGYQLCLAEHPAGPFEFVKQGPDLRFAEDDETKNGDFTVFVDDDGTGYLAYTVVERKSDDLTRRHQVFIERLTDDYLDGTGAVSAKLAWNCEAPAMFRRDGTYYVLFDNTCCWCPAGTGCRVYTAEDPLGPYAYRGDINRAAAEDPREVASRNRDTEPGEGREDAIIPMQPRRMAELPTPRGRELILIGDRWESNPDGLKGHDYTYWTSPLEFDEDGMIRRLQWEDHWSITLEL